MVNLMELPAELRVKIYEYALVRDVIRIVRTVHPFEAVNPFGLKKRHFCYEEPNPGKMVTLRSREVTLINVRYSAGGVLGDEISLSYGIQPNRFPPMVNLFLTSRQVYSEASPVFYQQNAFAFTTPHQTYWSAQDCLRFLYDRPYHALRHIRELHLLIGDRPQYPIRLKLASIYWQRLLDELSRHMSVRVLVLYIRGRTDDARRYRLPDQPWKEWLCKITRLQELHIDIIGDSTDEENIAFVQQMRSKMVVGGEQMGTEGFVLGKRSIPEVEWANGYPRNSLLTSLNIPDMEENYCS